MSATSNQIILVTGGTGFAGSHLVEALLAQGQTNIHVTSSSAKDSFVSDLLDRDKIHLLDLADKSATAGLIDELQPSQIYHLASIAKVGESFAQATEILQNNIAIYISMLEAVRDHAPQTRLLVTLSADEYQPSDKPLPETAPLHPRNPYGVSKMAQELLVDVYAHAYNLDVVKVRPFNHIGERQQPAFVVSAFAQQIAKIEQAQQTDLAVGNLSATRDFTDVKDTVQAYIKVMNQGQSGQVYNVGSGQGFTIQEILDRLVSLSKTDISVRQDPGRIRPIDVPYIVADISKISGLGWSTTIPIQQTLARVLEYWRANV